MHIAAAGARTCDHVLDVVCVPRAVHVRIVPRSRLVLHAAGVDGDAARALLWRLVDRIKCHRAPAAVLCHHLKVSSIEQYYPLRL